MIKTALTLTAIGMALGLLVQIRTESWGLAALMGVVGAGALVLLAVVMRRERQ